ncbi:MAG: T9SS type A sorting domain-containing protein [candidate division WOR-3 bacterium]|nr:T9SS type A sorting domain-containing protein [candidate division WOR-3 bacterium]
MVFDAAGQKVDELHSAQTSGTITWGKCYGPGVYFIRVECDASATIHKVILIH